MTFPTAATRNNSITNPASTNHVVALPTGIVAGSLVIIHFASDGTSVPSWPAGWTQITGITSFDPESEVRGRICDGTEGATITVTTGVAEESVHRSWRMSGHHATTFPEGVSGSNGGFNPNPGEWGALSPSWGAEDTLWLVMGAWNAVATVSDWPDNYTNTFYQASGATNFESMAQAVGERNLNAASEDPTTFTISADRAGRTHIIAIRPAAVGAPTTTFVPWLAEEMA